MEEYFYIVKIYIKKILILLQLKKKAVKYHICKEIF